MVVIMDPQAGIVRILRPNGRTAGTGFVVTVDGLIATCAHVVDTASQGRGDSLPDKVQVTFLKATGDKRETSVQPEHWLPRDAGDVAILQLDGTLPPQAKPLPLGSARNTQRHPFLTYGYPGVRVQSLRAGRGEIIALLPREEGPDALQLSSVQVTRGYSGGPVWDEQDGYVVGMVTDIEAADTYERGITTAYATPSEVLRDACSALSLGSPTNLGQGLPLPPTVFVGRDDIVEDALALLRRDDVRLLTMTGPGGVGKTRLALRVAAAARGDFADGAAFVDLTPIRDPDLVSDAILKALGVRDETAKEPGERLRDYLADKEMLLLLDNFEQVLDAAPILANLLRACSGLEILATSREPLDVAWERRFPVCPLNLPVLTVLPPVEDLAKMEAVALFVQRAQAVNPAFQLTTENARAVAEICARLDGLPLAIELAAARVKLLTPTMILERFEDRLELPGEGPRDAPARQRTLRAAIDWSHDLLSSPERVLFRRLAVFAGGCTIEAAEAVVGVAGALGVEVLLGLESLVDSSLLRQANGPVDEPRLSMLETIREYALELLNKSSEEQVMREEHFKWCLALAQERKTQYGELDAEHDNLRAALQWALDNDRVEEGLQLAVTLGGFWWWRGHTSEGRLWISRLIQRSQGVPPALRAEAFDEAGRLAWGQGDFETAENNYRESLKLRRQLNDTHAIATSYELLGNVYHARGQYDAARDFYTSSLDLRSEVGDDAGQAESYYILGELARNQGDASKARSYHEESLGIWRTLGNQVRVVETLNRLGEVALAQHHYEAAKERITEGLQIARQLQDTGAIAASYRTLAGYDMARGDYAAAREHFEQSLALYEESNNPQGQIFAQGGLAKVARLQGDYSQARAHCRQHLKLDRQIGNTPGLAWALEELATIEEAAASPALAARLLGAAERVRAEHGSARQDAEDGDFTEMVAKVRSTLGDEPFTDARGAGAALTEEQVLAEVLAEPDPGAPDAPA